MAAVIAPNAFNAVLKSKVAKLESYMEHWQEHTPFGGKYVCDLSVATQYVGACTSSARRDDDGKLV